MKRKKFLVVDDDEFSRKLVGMMLKKINNECDIFFANNGREAINTFLTVDPDLIFMDMHMPHMDGEKAIAEIRQYNTKIPIVVMSSANLRCRSEETGANDFVIKPFALEHIQDFCSTDDDSV